MSHNLHNLNFSLNSIPIILILQTFLIDDFYRYIFTCWDMYSQFYFTKSTATQCLDNFVIRNQDLLGIFLRNDWGYILIHELLSI